MVQNPPHKLHNPPTLPQPGWKRSPDTKPHLKYLPSILLNWNPCSHTSHGWRWPVSHYSSHSRPAETSHPDLDPATAPTRPTASHSTNLQLCCRGTMPVCTVYRSVRVWHSVWVISYLPMFFIRRTRDGTKDYIKSLKLTGAVRLHGAHALINPEPTL